MPEFRIASDFVPTGDQPRAIDRLVDGLRSQMKHQTLLGVTGLRQDIHDGERYRADAAAFARSGAQQDARSSALLGVQGVLPGERRRVLRLATTTTTSPRHTFPGPISTSRRTPR